MNETQSQSLNERILAALDLCITKMSDRLRDSFNPDDKQSLSLFKQFCASLKTRMQWLKSVMLAEGKAAPKEETRKPAPEMKASVKPDSPSLLDMLLNARKNESPILPEHLQSGLICNR
jgi:hypothetical protein